MRFPFWNQSKTATLTVEQGLEEFHLQKPLLIHGSASQDLAAKVSRLLQIDPGAQEIEQFPDGEIHVRIDESVRGRDVYIIQSTCPPVNEHLMELFIMIDTLRRASAASISVIIPYYGYARQDRKVVGREPITAKLIANLLATAGAHRVVVVDLHNPAIQGFFDIGMDHLTALHTLASHIQSLSLKDAVIVSPDTGGVKRADAFANLLGLPLAIMHKHRATAHSVEIQAIIGDIAGKRAIIIDDIISTGGTVRKAVDALISAGALPDVSVLASHAVLSDQAVTKLVHPAIKRVIVTDSVYINEDTQRQMPMLHIVSLAPLLAHAIIRLQKKQSLSALFTNQDGTITVPWSV